MKTLLSCLIMILAIASPAVASELENFESGDPQWTQTAWFDPGYSVNANWQVQYLDAEHGHVYLGTDFGVAVATDPGLELQDMSVAALVKMAAISHGGAHSSLVARFRPSERTGYEFGIRTDETAPGHYVISYILVSMDGGENEYHSLAEIPSSYTVDDGGETAWFVLELRIVGSQIECYSNGQPVISVTDSRWSSGQAGVLSATHCDWGSRCHETLVDDVALSDLSPVPVRGMSWGILKSGYSE